MTKTPILTAGDDGVFEPSSNAVVIACRAGAAVFIDAASAEHAARDKWVKAAKVAVKAGVTVAMLIKGTEKAPNPQFDKDVVAVLRSAIVNGVSASKKGMKFSTPLPGAAGADIVSGKMFSWTVNDLLALTTAQLRDIDDDVLKTQRRTFMQLVDGPMMSRLKGHIDKIENPDKARGTKEKNESAKPAPDAPLLDRAKALVNELTAALLTMKRPDGTGMDGLIQAHDAACELAARLGQIK
jgi:hypothetical protein